MALGLRYILGVFLCLQSVGVWSQSGERKFFFDAENSGFNFKTTAQKYEGNVVMIGQGIIMAADKIEINAKTKTIVAKGHVVFLTKDQIMVGEKVTFFQEKQNLVIENGSLTINGEEAIKRAVDKILGFTLEEVQFEEARARRLIELNRQIQRLAEEYSEVNPQQKVALREDYIGRMRVLLEKRELVIHQPNQVLSLRTDRVQESILRRRAYWQENNIDKLLADRNLDHLGYFHINGQMLEKIDEDDFFAQNSFFTSCYCEEDEYPAWGFWSSELKVHIDGYADFKHPILKIKGIPVLYLPFLRVPVKHRRQSGLLFPNFSWNDHTGTTFTQPLFLDLGPNKDVTITEKLLLDRGLLHDVEFRYKQRQFSGWTLGAGLINDREWRREINSRDFFRDAYIDGLASARANTGQASAGTIGVGKAGARKRIAEPDFWRDNGKSDCLDGTVEKFGKCVEDIYFNTNTPQNAWRGFVNWQGLSIFAPRLSLVTKGDMSSDHRFRLDFDSGYDLLQGDILKAHSSAFARSGARVHYDQSNYYLGLGASFGDYMKLDAPFMGRQMPLEAIARSRYFSLFPNDSWMPIPFYAAATFDYRRLSEFDSAKYALINPISLTLGHGHWQRTGVEVISPLLTGGIFQLDFFADAEARLIRSEHIGEGESGKVSMRTGLDLRLPMDGRFRFPNFVLPPKFIAEEKQRYVHHLMTWGLGYSIRPFVDSWGPYATSVDVLNPEGKGLSYFPTDRPVIIDRAETGVIDEDVLIEHRRLSFGTNHVFRVYDNVKQEPVHGFSHILDNEKLDYLKQAEQILDYPDNPASAKGANRINLPYSIPLTLGASIDYDFLDAKKRRMQKAGDMNIPGTLAEPWKELESEASLRTQGFVFDFRNSYNFYRDFSLRNLFGMQIPTFFKTKLAFSYLVEKDKTIKKSALKDSDTQTIVDFVRTRSVKVETNIIPYVKGNVYFANRNIDQTGIETRSEYQTSYGLTYISPSRCWGLNFARVKDFHLEEKEASYLLRFEISFAGQTRQLPNMGKTLLPSLFAD